MKYGFTIPGRGPLASPDTLLRIARHGEELGFDSIQTGDHILVPKDIDSTYPYTDNGEFPGLSSGSSLEQLTLLAFLAGQTSNIRLVTSVLIVPHRNPLVAAKTLATLDVLSKGRLVIGIGVGWMKEEFEALGLHYFDQRGTVTNEYLEIYKELWTKDRPTFSGKFFNIGESGFLPKPFQTPHPPIWIGGHSSPALRRAAQYGDGWMPIGLRPPAILEPEELSDKINIIKDLSIKFGRSEDSVTPCFSTHITINDKPTNDRAMMQGIPEQIAADLRLYQDVGVQNFIVSFPASSLSEQQESMERFAREVIPLMPI